MLSTSESSLHLWQNFLDVDNEYSKFYCSELCLIRAAAAIVGRQPRTTCNQINRMHSSKILFREISFHFMWFLKFCIVLLLFKKKTTNPP